LISTTKQGYELRRPAAATTMVTDGDHHDGMSSQSNIY
jgi:hypothetical protein